MSTYWSGIDTPYCGYDDSDCDRRDSDCGTTTTTQPMPTISKQNNMHCSQILTSSKLETLLLQEQQQQQHDLPSLSTMSSC